RCTRLSFMTVKITRIGNQRAVALQIVRDEPYVLLHACYPALYAAEDTVRINKKMAFAVFLEIEGESYVL
ncbi:MAG: hypothetical protein Q7W54_02535, partial [Bacteroidota bacterium]|nr:hypothetical protein [Bacteroidota bacterium]